LELRGAGPHTPCPGGTQGRGAPQHCQRGMGFSPKGWGPLFGTFFQRNGYSVESMGGGGTGHALWLGPNQKGIARGASGSWGRGAHWEQRMVGGGIMSVCTHQEPGDPGGHISGGREGGGGGRVGGGEGGGDVVTFSYTGGLGGVGGTPGVFFNGGGCIFSGGKSRGGVGGWERGGGGAGQGSFIGPV